MTLSICLVEPHGQGAGQEEGKGTGRGGREGEGLAAAGQGVGGWRLSQRSPAAAWGLLTARSHVVDRSQLSGEEASQGLRSRRALNGEKLACLGYFKNHWMCKNSSSVPVGFGANGSQPAVEK